MSESFFVRIENPNSVRRKVLESSKEIIQNLKAYQMVLDIREEKTQSIKDLRIQLKETNMLMDKIKELFPADLISKFKEERSNKEAETEKEGKKDKKKTKKSSKTIPEPSELAKLENKLSDIESKLKTLG